MNVYYPAEKNYLRHLFSSRGLFRGWLFRGLVDFTVPLFDPIALKLLLTNVNDDNPSSDVGNNKFTATMALSLEF